MECLWNGHQPVYVYRFLTRLAETVSAVFESVKRVFDEAELLASP